MSGSSLSCQRANCTYVLLWIVSLLCYLIATLSCSTAAHLNLFFGLFWLAEPSLDRVLHF